MLVLVPVLDIQRFSAQDVLKVPRTHPASDQQALDSKAEAEVEVDQPERNFGRHYNAVRR